MLSIKKGAEVNALTVPALLALIVVNEVYTKYGFDCVLTEGSGGKHGRASLHYVGNAIDIRTRNVPASAVEGIAEDIRNALGEQYDVIVEGTHLHIEYQPK